MLVNMALHAVRWGGSILIPLPANCGKVMPQQCYWVLTWKKSKEQMLSFAHICLKNFNKFFATRKKEQGKIAGMEQ